MSEPLPPVRLVSSRHAISVLIVTAAILWNLAALAHTSGEQTGWPSIASQFIVGLAFAQTGLAAGYFVWGRWNVAVRAVVVLAAVLASSSLSARAEPVISRPAWLTIHLATALACWAPLLAIRCLGLSLQHADLPSPLTRRRQFSILDLLSAMAGVALIAAASRWGTFPAPANLHSIRAVAAVLVAEAGITWVCIVAPLALRTWWEGGSAAVGGTFFIAIVLLGSPSDDEPVVMSAMVQGLVIALVAAVLRLGGYRLAWRSRLIAAQIQMQNDAA